MGAALLNVKPDAGMGDLQVFAMSLAAFIFAIALIASVFCAGDVGLIETGKTVRELDSKERSAIQRYLVLAIAGFFLGLGIVTALLFQVMVLNLGKLLFS